MSPEEYQKVLKLIEKIDYKTGNLYEMYEERLKVYKENNMDDLHYVATEISCLWAFLQKITEIMEVKNG